MKWWSWILALLPLGVGILVLVLANTGIIASPVLYIRGNLGTLAILGGVITSLIIIVAAQLWAYNHRKHQRAIRGVQKTASEDRRHFLQRLDHELKNPLTAIKAGLSNLTYEPLDDYLAGEVSAVQAQVQRISRLVADLRKLAALETTPVDRVEVNVGELLSQVSDLVKEQTNGEARKIALILPNAPWPVPRIEGDPDLLLLAIHNLLDNAVKYTCPGDTIEVRAFDDGSEVVIEVADTGPGIPEVEIERIWEELYRGEQARGVPGSGLGLPMVRAIIERHGGSVAVRSRSNQGTAFSVRLPAK
ncbi:MAG TPA: HAMP domain-containing sensor histidine kinase [Anaerolineales bacterium]|jgi:signal transduction histidine kinase|nr:HAMP domain-containing sensor histidine kinase [Anaerolineales bacterium]